MEFFAVLFPLAVFFMFFNPIILFGSAIGAAFVRSWLGLLCLIPGVTIGGQLYLASSTTSTLGGAGPISWVAGAGAATIIALPVFLLRRKSRGGSRASEDTH